MNHNEKILKRRANVPIKYRALFDRCMDGTASPREAIKMHCLECFGYVQSETELCDNATCPLYQYRPYQTAPSRPVSHLEALQSKNSDGGMV